MKQLLAIVRREVGAFFYSPMAAMVLTGFLIAVGLFFTIYLFGYSDMSLAALQSPRSGNFLNLAESLFRPLVRSTIFFLLFLMPAISMRLFSPEFRSGRYDLIASWPVSDQVWVAGKWLAAFVSAAVMIGCATAYFLVVWFLGSPEIGPAVAAVLGQLLLTAALAAWGVLASTMFRHQMVAYFLAFIWSFFLYIIGALARFLTGPLARVTEELSFLNHFENLGRGVLDSRDLLFFVLMTAVPLFAATAVMSGRRLPARRRVAVWTPTLVVSALSVVLFVLAQNFVWTVDLTGNKRYSLAPQTQQILDGLAESLATGAVVADLADGQEPPQEVKAYAFYQRLDPARDTTEALLKACAQRSRRFDYELLDPETELELVRKFGVTVSRTIVIEVGERFTSVLQPDESALISAVYRLAAGKQARVLHLTGHGEHLLDSIERPGYASYDQLLLEQGYDVRALDLSVAGSVPEAVDLVVIAGPRIEPGPGDLAALNAHLARGKAVLAMFDPPTPPGWVRWMARWNIGLTGDVLISVEHVGSERGLSARTIFVAEGYGDHEVSRPLQGITSIFPMVQPLSIVGEPDSVVAGAVILQSSEMTWAETDPETRFFGRPSFNKDEDHQGPQAFGMVLELSLNPGGTPGRMVVIGNSEFANNANLNLGANRDLLLNAVGWLAREEELVEMRGRDPLSQPVVLTPDARRALGYGAILGWPILVGSLALGLMLRHRRSGRGGPA